ncbi:MAG: NAD(P)/FAD-dependent oxidoreductase [Haliscomenobacter sp.]|uniref:NAD(P)/FAD-dependent oxidoreductase n=1 Tax=Haliscomenobacter sp. TaxID=2717303 RepID=UPI0029B49D8E|nr:NAD(P)/FAD-dependent oxidoreductase [Haliscomenobacter sp.]MDX2068390.1 NAD(P)/FAD-dependent oxidoreductase [Haliscomenobacter sp.]
MNRQEFLRNLALGALSLQNVEELATHWVPEKNTMTQQNESFSEVIILGGSYAGLAAAMALGRSLRKVLVLDAGEPCNRQTPHSHNFLTQDGQVPAHIGAVARAEVLQYPTVRLRKLWVSAVQAVEGGFQVTGAGAEVFQGKKLLLATGVKDQMPDLPGFAESWGISVLHCPYCHGYEVKKQELGVLANGETAFEMARLIDHWSSGLTLFTNGPMNMEKAQVEKLQAKNIRIIETPIRALEHQAGYLQKVHFEDGSHHALKALFARVPFTQSSAIAKDLGCAFTEMGHIQVNDFKKTNVPGVFAAGDNTTPMRAVAAAVAAGTMAGAMINHELIVEDF